MTTNTRDTSIQLPTAVAPEPVPRPRSRKDRRAHNRPLVPIEVEVTGFASGARGIGRAEDGRVVFVEYALPGERVVAEVTADRPDYIEATAVRVLRPSPSRVVAPCRYYGRCGGCQLQHAEYGEQLRLKTGIVREQLVRIGRFPEDAADALVRPMLGASEPWGYRNHMRFNVRRDGQVGFMQKGTHRFMRINECLIALPRVNELLAQVQGRTEGARQVAVRVGEHTGDEMIQPRLRWRTHGRKAARGPRPESGQPHYRERLGGRTYRISGPAFFQVNTRQAERLLSLVLDRVLEARPRVVVDAYAGVGTFAAALAERVERVVTIEESAAAGDDAEVNLAGLDNVERVVAKVEDALPAMQPAPDAVVFDPPRAGLARSVVEAVIESPVRRVVYVSCDSATLARDLRLLSDGGFAVREVQPVDMFPQTQHIECVTTLDREPHAGRDDGARDGDGGDDVAGDDAAGTPPA